MLELAPHDIEMTVRILLGFALGALLGWERERAGRPAGLRTFMMVTAGSAAYTVVSIWGFSGEGNVPGLRVAEAVRAAIAAGRPVVALESTLISHGLPRPRNLDIARHLEAVVRQGGAVPATVGIIGGQPIVGLSADELATLAT